VSVIDVLSIFYVFMDDDEDDRRGTEGER